MVDDYCWPMQFVTPEHAIRFADGHLNSPRLKSQAGELMRSSIQESWNKAVDKNGERITGGRLEDLAGTISACLARCDNPGGLMYRHFYGRYETTLELAEQLSHAVYHGPDKGRTIGVTRDVALMVIEEQRMQRLGRGRYYYSQMAKDLGITRDVFNQVWRSEIKLMREVINQWVESARRQFCDELGDRRII